MERCLCQLCVEVKPKQVVEVDSALMQNLQRRAFILTYKRGVIGMDVSQLVVLQLDISLTAFFSGEFVHS